MSVCACVRDYDIECMGDALKKKFLINHNVFPLLISLIFSICTLCSYEEWYMKVFKLSIITKRRLIFTLHLSTLKAFPVCHKAILGCIYPSPVQTAENPPNYPVIT